MKHHHHRERLHLQSRKIGTNNIIIISSNNSSSKIGDVQMPNDPTKFPALSRHAEESIARQAPLIYRIWQSLHDAGNTPPHEYNFPLRPTDWMTNVRAGRHLPEVESAYLGGGGRRGRARRQIFDDGLAAADQHGQIGQPEEQEEPGNPGQPGSPEIVFIDMSPVREQLGAPGQPAFCEEPAHGAWTKSLKTPNDSLVNSLIDNCKDFIENHISIVAQ